MRSSHGWMKITVAVLLFAQPLSALGYWGWMRNAALNEFNDADWEMLKAEAGKTLNDAADGERVDWKNPQTGNGGSFKPIMTFVHDGSTCRRLAVLSVSNKGTRGVLNYTLCQQEDASWKFVSDSEIE